MNGHAKYRTASTADASTHRGLAPTRSARRPSGSWSSSVTPAAMDMPSPTWAPLSPTSWVKNTAVPVRNEPVAKADRTHWIARSRSSLVGGRIPRNHRTSTRHLRYLDVKITPVEPPVSGRSAASP